MIIINDVIQYNDVCLGTLSINILGKLRKYKVFYLSQLAGTVNGFHHLPSGKYSVRFRPSGVYPLAPYVIYNHQNRFAILPFTPELTFMQMMPGFYVKTSDMSFVSRDEWRAVCGIMASYDVSDIEIFDPVTTVDKNYIHESKGYDFENW